MLRPSLLVTNQALRTSDCGTSYFSDYFSFGDSHACSITMRSTAFDAYLEVYDGSGNLVASNDDGTGSTDAVITLSECYRGSDSNLLFALTARATSYDAGSTGPYTLEFRFGVGSVVSSESRQLVVQGVRYPAVRSGERELRVPKKR